MDSDEACVLFLWKAQVQSPLPMSSDSQQPVTPAPVYLMHSSGFFRPLHSMYVQIPAPQHAYTHKENQLYLEEFPFLKVVLGRPIPYKDMEPQQSFFDLNIFLSCIILQMIKQLPPQ